MPTALAFAIQMLTELPSLITAGVDVINLIQSTNSVLKTAQAAGEDPTDADWAALDKIIKDLRAQRPTI